MRRLLPGPADDITVDDAYGTALGSRTDGPWVGLCMVASIDGSTAVDGASAKLSSPTDTAVLGRLRQLADVIVVGAGTVRDEGYGAPRKPGQRVGVVTQSGQLDFAGDLFGSGAGFVITSDTGAQGVPPGPSTSSVSATPTSIWQLRSGRFLRSSVAPTTCRSRAAQRSTAPCSMPI
jgi:hypothetical protein